MEDYYETDDNKTKYYGLKESKNIFYKFRLNENIIINNEKQAIAFINASINSICEALKKKTEELFASPHVFYFYTMDGTIKAFITSFSNEFCIDTFTFDHKRDFYGMNMLFKNKEAVGYALLVEREPNRYQVITQ